LQKGIYVDKVLVDKLSILEYNHAVKNGGLAYSSLVGTTSIHKPILASAKSQYTYAKWRSVAVTNLVIETKRINKSECASSSFFTFASTEDTSNLRVEYNSIPYGRRGYEAYRPKISKSLWKKLDALARKRGMSVDSNAFYCICTVYK
jgi:hypothetical protein